MQEEQVSLIDKYFDQIILSHIKELIQTDLSNNDKASRLIRYMVDDVGFIEIGTGTNRTVFKKDGLIFKIALDMYGQIDNKVEFLLSNYECNLQRNLKEEFEVDELEPDDDISIIDFLTECYEIDDDGLLVVQEYVDVIEYDQFISRKSEILHMCKKISKRYIFDDIGYSQRNYKNFGIRDDKVIILDYGYLKPSDRIDFTCTNCNFGDFQYNKLYTKLVCDNCGYTTRPILIFKNEIKRSKIKHNAKSKVTQSDFIDEEDIKSIDNAMEMELPNAFDVFVNNVKY